MKCPTCQTDNKEGAKFCIECGHQFELKCSNAVTCSPWWRSFVKCAGIDYPSSKEILPIDYSKPQSYTPKFLAG